MAPVAFARVTGLLAQESEFPAGKALLGLLSFGVVGLFSAVCLFAPDDTLRRYAGIIGTQNPLVARAVCGIGAVVGLLLAAVMGLALAGVIK